MISPTTMIVYFFNTLKAWRSLENCVHHVNHPQASKWRSWALQLLNDKVSEESTKLLMTLPNAHEGHGLRQCMNLCWFVVESHDGFVIRLSSSFEGFAIRSSSSFEMHRLTQQWGSYKVQIKPNFVYVST